MPNSKRNVNNIEKMENAQLQRSVRSLITISLMGPQRFYKTAKRQVSLTKRAQHTQLFDLNIRNGQKQRFFKGSRLFKHCL